MEAQLIFFFMYIGAFLVILAFSEISYKKWSIKADYTRKISHFVTTLSSLSFIYTFQSHWFVFALAVFSFLLLFIGKLKNSFKSIENVSRLTLGSYLLPIGIYFSFVVSTILNNKLLFVLPILILAISDTSAGLIGIIWNREKRKISVFGTTLEKTIEGTFVFLITSFIISAITFLIHGYCFPKIIALTLIIPLATTITELVSPYGSDNLSIPVVASTILVYIL